MLASKNQNCVKKVGSLAKATCCQNELKSIVNGGSAAASTQHAADVPDKHWPSQTKAIDWASYV